MLVIGDAIVPLFVIEKFATPVRPLKEARMAFEPMWPAPPLIALPVMLIGEPFAPSVAEVLFDTLPDPPPMKIPSPLGKPVIVFALMVPVVRWDVVEGEPC